MKQVSSLCINNNSFTIPLFTTRMLRMKFNRTRLKQLNIHTIRLHAFISDQKVAEFQDHRDKIEKVFHLTKNIKQYDNESIMIYNLNIHAKYINQTNIQYFIEIINIKNHIYSINCSIVLIISQPERMRDKIFKNLTPFMLMFISIQMGILLDIEILKELIRRPIQISIGFVCQYIFMPLIAFSISKLFQYQPLYGLGLFIVGCCPGGSASNQWTVLFDGDLNLSAFMTFASTVASFFMMPLWLYTLGQYAYLRELEIRIPFLNLLLSLLTIIGPMGLGMIICHFIPKLKSIIKRILKPMLILFICYFFVFGAFVNYYLFHYIDLQTALTIPLLPWLGFLLGGLFAWICRQDSKRIVTIGIETGIQHIGIAFMVLLYSLPAPENSQATIIPLIAGYVSVLPFCLVLIYQLIRGKCCKTQPVDHHISIDTLSKTTFELSEAEAEPVDDISQTKKESLPITILDSAVDSKST
ncbi:unnamed protein product [Rotaria sp. Silwood1]|nr:unnamed protein product [Rotaria sp. Silwood1]CAF3454394.1 unnamed protein product [Rotaria sp. Silwood1]CAF4601374.1 unnamed protein product [Rotaria sp. Silwood1]CAF4670993.1 unnamed protein product [Rotaria sp. Silwood1]